MAGDVHIRKTFLLNIESIVFVSFVLIFNTLPVSHGAINEQPKGLYDDKDSVVILKIDNFKETLYDSPTAWMIEFYSSWCGHCVRFAPTWKELAVQVKGWKPVLQIGAIDCAHSSNFPLCKEYGVEAYPSLKFIAAGTIDDNKGILYKEGRTVSDLVNAIVDYIDTQSANSHSPPSWPKLQPLKSLEGIWQNVQHAIQYTVVVLEENDSMLGKQVILDLCMHKNLLIRRMLKDEALMLAIDSIPALLLIKQDGTFTKLDSKPERDAYVQTLKKLLGLPPDNLHSLAQAQRTTELTQVLSYPDGVHMQDLESALHYTLRMEIPRIQTLQLYHIQIIKQFIQVLVKYLPARSFVIQYLKKINEWLRYQNVDLTGDEWLLTINTIQTSVGYLTPIVKWTGCAGSSSSFRGYPCSMWTLFHTLIVNAAQNIDDKQFDPLEVPHAMRDYIVVMFGCRDCADNFKAETVAMDSQIKNADEAIMWLWRTHNSVNARLKGDLTEDPKHPKLQFPPPGMCGACWTSHRGKAVFNEDEVLAYLKRFYSSVNIINDTEEHKFQPLTASTNSYGLHKAKVPNKQSKKVNKKLDRLATVNIEDVTVSQRVAAMRDLEKQTRLLGYKPSSWGFSSIDISLCVAFYFLCTIILILVYYHFSVNRKMRLSLSMFTNK